MYEDLKNLLNLKIAPLQRNHFQEFINYLFNLYYGENYTPIRPQQDQGNDGCLEDKTKLFAVYAPETGKNFAEVRDKFTSDFGKYKQHWSENYQQFVFIFNSPEQNVLDKTAEQQQLALKHESEFWTRGYLLDDIIGNLKFSNIRKLAIEYLGIDEYQYTFSIIKWVVSDMQKEYNNINDIDYTLPIDIDEKIVKNFNKNIVASIRKKIQNFHKDFSKLEEILKDEQTSKVLKIKVINTFNEANPQISFYERIKIMKKYLSKESEDDDYLYYVECIIFYIFAQCLIGIRND